MSQAALTHEHKAARGAIRVGIFDGQLLTSFGDSLIN